MATSVIQPQSLVPGASGQPSSPFNSAIPGFSGLSSATSDLIKQLMSGQLTTGARRAIFDAGAERGVASGMPGGSTSAGSLFANADLRNIGRASEDQQQRGFQDFLALIQGLSGTVVPTTGQQIQAGQFDRNLAFQQQQAAQQNELQQQEYMQRYSPKPKEYSRKMIAPIGGNAVPGGFKEYSFFK